MTETNKASTLDDTGPSPTIVVPHPQTANCLWPVGRYGRVLDPQSGEPLRIDKAQRIGSLFEPGQPAAVRYLEERRAELQRLATKLNASYLLDWPAHLDHHTPPFNRLGETWKAEEFQIGYAFVPVVRMPRFVLEIGEFAWQVRESLTVCGDPAKSKAWFSASLIVHRGRPTDLMPLTHADLADARDALAPFVEAAMESLIEYYLRVLNEDSKTLNFETPLVIDALQLLAETEIVVSSSLAKLADAFRVLDTHGFGVFRRQAMAGEFAGAAEVADFLNWTEPTAARVDEGWTAGQPKVLAIYADDVEHGIVRALVVPQVHLATNRTWYAALTEPREPGRHATHFPLSEAASRYLAQEYGRYF